MKGGQTDNRTARSSATLLYTVPNGILLDCIILRTHLGLAVDNVQPLLVDGNDELLRKARVRALRHLEESRAIGRPPVDNLSNVVK